MSGGGGGGKTTSTSTTQNYSPEEAARRARVMDEAQNVYNQTKGQYAATGYPGSQVVPFDLYSLMGQGSALTAADQIQAGNQQLGGGLNYGLSTAMDVTNNPYLQRAVDASLQRVTNKYTDPNGVLANIRNGAQNAGQYGGSRQGVAEGIAAREYGQTLGDTAAQMYSDAYNKGQDTFSRTLATAPGVIQGYALPGQLQSAVGAQREGLAQAMEDYNAAQRNWMFDAQWAPLNNYANIVYGGGGSQSSTSGTAPVPQRNPLLGAVGGGLAGYSAGAAMGAGLGPYGAAAGAILGAIL